MSEIKRVAIAGATGNLGPAITEQLVKAGFEVTALSRQGSSSAPPAGVKKVEVDYDSVESSTSALKGQDAVVSVVGSLALGGQSKIVDAAVAAGVKRFLPSEYGCDTTHEKTSKSPVFKAKVDTQNYLKEKASKGEITYSLSVTGPFLDWGLQSGFVVNLKGGPTKSYNGGDKKRSATTLEDIGKAVAGISKKPEETKNRTVYVQSAVITQNHLLELAKKAKGDSKVEPEVVDTAEIEKKAYHELQNGSPNIGSTMVSFITVGIWSDGFGSSFEKPDNELSGVKEKTDEELSALVAKYV